MGSACCQARDKIEFEPERNTLEKQDGWGCDCIGNPYSLVQFTVVDIEGDNKGRESDEAKETQSVEENKHRVRNKKHKKRKKKIEEQKRNSDDKNCHSKPEKKKLNNLDNFSKLVKQNKKANSSRNISQDSPSHAIDSKSLKYFSAHKTNDLKSFNNKSNRIVKQADYHSANEKL